MILASAQTKPKRGDINANLLDHYRLVKIAADHGADLIVFPEMSITGYEREKAGPLAFTPNDTRLDKLAQLSIDKNIIIIAGSPIRLRSNLYIGEFVLQPQKAMLIYTKQFLHPGEEVYFTSSFENNPMIEYDTERISLAICADIDHPLHPEFACKKDSTIYIPSIFFSPNGIPSAHSALSSYAEKFSMDVLMSNFGGDSWGQPSGGRSAFWNKNGSLVLEMDQSSSGLLIIEKNKDAWKGQIIVD